MRIGVRLLSGVMGVVLVGVLVGTSHHVRAQRAARPTIATEADFRRAMKELSN